MKFKGSKSRIAKHILHIMLKERKPNQVWVEPFVGGANMIDKVEGKRVGSDVNVSLIMCLDALSKGWEPPEFITRDQYNYARSEWYSGINSALIGYIGINGSYGGRWFDGGYAGISSTKNNKERNYPLEAYKNVISQASNLRGIEFTSCSYDGLDIPDNSLIYCDPPYENTKEYLLAKNSGFDSQIFWQWCRDMVKQGHTVFVSEYDAPDDFECIWQQEVKSSLSANGKCGGSKKSIEKLFTIKNKTA